MFKKARFVFISVICLLISVICAYAQDSDSITITTYYPSPYGVYNQLQTNSLGVGDTNGDGNFNAADVPPATPGATNGDVWIAGNVGIGTTEVPERRNLIVHSSNDQGNIWISGVSDSGATYSALYLDDNYVGDVTNEGNFWVIAHKKMLGDSREDSLYIARKKQDGSWIDPAMMIDKDGNVGIGTRGPGQKLDVRGNIKFGVDQQDAYISGQANGGTIMIKSNSATADRYFRLGWMDNNYVFQPYVEIKEGGNVGIGTTNPTQKLDVADRIHATGDICTDAGGGKCLSSAGSVGGSAYFGGMYMQDWSSSACYTVNPITGSCSCPAGFSSQIFKMIAMPAAAFIPVRMAFCYKN